MRAVLLSMRLVVALALDMLRAVLAQGATMRTLRYWPTLFVHMQKFPICLIVSACKCEICVSHAGTDLDVSKPTLGAPGRMPHRHISRR